MSYIEIDTTKTAQEIADSIYEQLEDHYGDDPDDVRYDEQEGAVEDTLEELPEMKELYEENGFGSLSEFLDDEFNEIEITEEQKKEIFITFKDKLNQRIS